MAGYPSRHPSDLEELWVEAEWLLNEIFTVSSVTSLNDVLNSRSEVSERAKKVNNEKSASTEGIKQK